jgi:Fe-S-cluster containining protein
MLHQESDKTNQPLAATISPLGYAKRVEQLMQLPGHLCKQRGICCQVATFKGLMHGAEILAVAANDTTILGEMAKDFLSIFEPYPNAETVIPLAPQFVDQVQTNAKAQGRHPDNVGYFKCRYVQADGRCGVHEDRPSGCRHYPIPHHKTLFHHGCGYQAQSMANWAEIESIMTTLQGLL